MRVVALGGGHGLHASLAALRRVVALPTAVVTVADDGGSSGRLRTELGVLPPGDLRMALAALCGDDDWGRTWSRLLQHRFGGDGELAGHVVGNLLIAGLWDVLDDQVEALDWVARLLGARGRVLPMASTPVTMTAQVRGLDPADPARVGEVRGQVAVATTEGRIVSVALDPEQPAPCPQAVTAVGEADWVVLGPGSWYTSVLPHLLVPPLREAVVRGPARVLVVLNLEDQPGETAGYGPEDHLAALVALAPELRVDTVLADPAAVGDPAPLERAAAALGARLVLAEVAEAPGVARHDPQRLAAAYSRVLGTPAPSAGPAAGR
nr:uridine diphosphate-N-acetylglucosamine-binding protein YvcK [Nocardioides perillae]